MIKAIIIDLDGTTLPRNWHQISEENRVALEEAGQRGVVRILATGRSVFSLNNTLPEGLPVDYMVFSSGAGIMRWDDKEILLTRELSAEETLRHCYPSLEIRYKFYHTAKNSRQPSFLLPEYLLSSRRFPTSYRELSRFGNSYFFDRRDTGRGHSISCYPRRTTTPATRGNSNKNCPTYSVIRSTSPIDNQAIWTEIFAPDVNKGTSCQLLLNQLNLRYEECAGLGNDYNDIDFLNRCGHPVYCLQRPGILTGAI